MGKLRVGVGEKRQIRQYEPKEYELSYEVDLGDNVNPSEVKEVADTIKRRLDSQINEWFEEDLKK